MRNIAALTCIGSSICENGKWGGDVIAGAAGAERPRTEPGNADRNVSPSACLRRCTRYRTRALKQHAPASLEAPGA
ncbi:hypothetical protein AT6N2_C3111 [Agrobacterium tumefaciens]|nr:hypothetical protein AT6N2_C3111 [Agrobacterium tumefaciens]